MEFCSVRAAAFRLPSDIQILICLVSQTFVYQARRSRILAARHRPRPVYAGQVRRTHSHKQDKQMREIGSWEGGVATVAALREEGTHSGMTLMNEEVGRQLEEE